MNTDVTVDTHAPVVVRRTVTVEAPLERVWRLHTDIDAWPTWNPDIERARLTGDLAPGSTFRWLTHGLDILSTIRQVDPGRCVAWGGPVDGITGIHVWTFHEEGGAVVVTTEESWSGAPVEARPEVLRAALDDSLARWLYSLRAAAGQPS